MLRSIRGRILMAVGAALCTPPALAQRPSIASISVCSSSGAGGQGSCPAGVFDTAQLVLAPGGGSVINKLNGMVGISDEHQSVFAPGTLLTNGDYLFFVATHTALNTSTTGVMVLSGGAGPNASGQWTFDLARADGYASYPSGYGQIFLAPIGRNCPTVLDSNPAHQDQTFDLTYAAPGSVVIDPTSAPGTLLMVYEGTTTCVGIVSGANSQYFYSTVGIATSRDWGRTWPTYRANATFNFVALPSQNTTQGPHSSMGAMGNSVCIGNDCTTPPPATYGRYAVLSPSVSMAAAAATGQQLPASMGDAEMSAFVDDASGGPARYLYVTYNYNPGAGVLADPLAPNNNLAIARAQLNGGIAPLSFLKWNGKSYAGAGLGGYDTNIFPTGPFENCEAQSQGTFGSSLSYVEDTGQYLLTFVCNSPGDPAKGQQAGAARGAAWFYSTSYDLSDPSQWSTPQEIAGSWSQFDTSGGCASYKGWYPTLMSLDRSPGHLTTGGYVFYLWGCQTDNTPPPGRQYSSRAFTITLSAGQRRRHATRH